MKMVIAFVQPFMAERVVQDLRAIEGLIGATFTEVRGWGRAVRIRTGEPDK
jgi:nitrogen regulatory protein PII